MQIIATQLRGRAGPNMAVEVDVKIEWERDQAFFLGITGQALYKGTVLSDSIFFQPTYWGSGSNAASLISRDRGAYHGKLTVPLRGAALHYIEENRKTEDVLLQLNIRYMWQEALTQPPDENGDRRYIAGSVLTDDTSVRDAVMTRSDWLKRLGELGWQEYEIFEIPKKLLLTDPKLEVALTRLREAQDCLRSCDHRGVLAKCRAAFESAAKYEVAGDDIKQGFESLLARSFNGSAMKQDTLNNLIAGLSKYSHIVGRHEQYPEVHVSREEAEFIYTASISLFSLLSQRLSKDTSGG